MNMPVDLSICIVNHRTPELTNACLRSIKQSADDLVVEVLITNNTRDEFSLNGLRFGKNKTEGVLFQNHAPLGFAANQTNMMRVASGKCLVALNSDTIIQAGAFQEILRFIKQHPRCGLAGPRVIHPDGTLQPTCRNFPSPINHFLEASGFWKWIRNYNWFSHRFLLAHSHDEVLSPDWITGVCMIVPRKVFEQVDGMNADLFPAMFAEDLEWCWRIRNAGYEIMFDPAATIIHHESASPLDNRAIKTYQGFYRFCAMHYSRSFCAGIRLATILALTPKALMSRDPYHRDVYTSIIKLPIH
jgi:GT2 family glycosyltransferase